MKRSSFYTVLFSLLFVSLSFTPVFANSAINVQFDANTQTGLEALDIVFLLLFLSLIPSLILLMSSFTRIIIVFSFLRNAMGLQQTPPNQVLLGLSLFLSLFIMAPVIDTVNETAYTPYREQIITQEEAFAKAQVPVKEFMLRQVDNASLQLFLDIAKVELVVNDTQSQQVELAELDLEILVPAFVTSELKRAFLIGFLLFIPFLAIDLIVASTLMSMGMVMLPPGMIALPFKVMLFVLADGWGLLMGSLVRGFS